MNLSHQPSKSKNGLSKKEAASKYNVALNTISTWLKNKEKIINAVTKEKKTFLGCKEATIYYKLFQLN